MSIVIRQFGPAVKKSSSPSGQQSRCRRTWHIAHPVPHGDGECCIEHWTSHRAQSGSTASSARSKRFIASPTAVVLAEWGRTRIAPVRTGRRGASPGKQTQRIGRLREYMLRARLNAAEEKRFNMSSITGVVYRVVMRNEYTCSKKDKVATKRLACVWNGTIQVCTEA